MCGFPERQYHLISLAEDADMWVKILSLKLKPSMAIDLTLTH